jgi:hypothetical protein
VVPDQAANVFMVLLAIWAIVFGPIIVAYVRRHRRRFAITLLNVGTLVLSLTLFPLLLMFAMPLWFGALIWSLTNNIEERLT